MIYLIVDLDNMYCKIGYSKNPVTRKSTLQTANVNELTLMNIISGDKSKETEIHNMFKDYNINREWFHYNKKIQDYFLEQHYEEYPNYKLNSNHEIDGVSLDYLISNNLIKKETLTNFKLDFDVLHKQGILNIFSKYHIEFGNYYHYILNDDYLKKSVKYFNPILCIYFIPENQY